MLQAGETIPEARVWVSTQEHRTLRELAREGPLLLLFYLFDWSST